MTRVRIPLFVSFLVAVVGNGCVAPGQATDDGPTDERSAQLLCGGGDYAQKYYHDNDHDGHYATYGTLYCNYPGPGWSDEPGDDCNDNDAKVYPGAPEIVGDGKDSNCDGKDPDGAGPVTSTYREISIKVFKLCDGDGTDCAAITPQNVQMAIDSLNNYLYRSDSKLRFKLSTSTAVITAGQISAANFGTIRSDSWNSACKPISGLSGYAQDANGDGKVDTNDNAFLCNPTVASSSFDADLTAFEKAVEAAGDVPVFARGGWKDVQFKDGIWQKLGWTGGYSSCEGHAVMLTSNWSSGTFMAHELGHYLCLPHAMSEDAAAPGSVPVASVMIKGYVERSGVSPTADASIFRALWDPDRNNLSSYTDERQYIQAFPINDTPPDPGTALWKSVYGTDNACTTSATSVTVPVTYGSPYYYTRNYVITPDRTLIMSYYKDCFGDRQHYTPQQIARMEVVGGPYGHKYMVGKDLAVLGWNNTLNYTIPPRPYLGVGDLQWVGSTVPVTGSGTIKRVRVHVDVSHPSAVNLQLVTPNGTRKLLDFTQNSGYVKGVFYVDGTGLTKTGNWTLQVAAQYGDPNGATGTINDWRLELE